MFTKKNNEDPRIERAISETFDAYSPYDDDGEKVISLLEKLHELKRNENPRRVSPDTLAIVTGNLIGIMLIIGHERAHVVTSKALNFVMKLR